LTASAAAQEEMRYERQGESIWATSSYGRFLVNPSIVSLRFRSDETQLVQLRTRLANERSAVADLTLVRANRLGVHDVRLADGVDPIDACEAIEATGLVEFCEPNTFGNWVGGPPNDSSFNTQWALHNTGQSGGTPNADVAALEAWDITVGDPSIVIAVLDSGTEITHSDLADNVWSNPGEVPNNSTDDDGNGFVDDVFGWDFSNGNNSVEGPFFHGTFVAGVVAARTNNSLGMAGLAGGFSPDDGCRVMALGVGDFGPNGAILDDAIIYAADNGARVITMSLTTSSSSAIDIAISYARNTRGVFVDCAAGNNQSVVGYPALNPNVVSVASTNRFDNKSGFSNPGPENWVAAPGEDVLSLDTSNSYTTSSGTSFSSPLVAALCGLMLSQLPSLTPDNLQDILKDTADDVGTAGFDEGTGWGRINAGAALEHVAASDCNGNGIYDPKELQSGALTDNDMNGIPDQCEGLGTNYCSTNQNSTGAQASIAASGSAVVADNDLTLVAASMPPGQFGYFMMSDSQAFVPLFGGSQGNLCLGSPLLRFALFITQVDGAGEMTLSADLNNLPLATVIAPGETWNFQCWFRDQNPGSTSNTTDGLAIPFL